MLEASVILPTYNRAFILRKCLSCLLDQNIDDYEIIVIDDASSDETPSLISEIRDPRIKSIRLDKQAGPYVARNAGIENARGRLLIFVDSDVLVHHAFVRDHVSIHKSNKRVWLQGMVHHVRALHQAKFRLYYPNAFCIGTLITQNVSVAKKWVDEVGGFEEFGSLIGFKDVDLGLRLKKIGLRPIHAFFRCKAYHVDGPPESKNLKEFFSKHYDRGKSAYFFRERHGNESRKFAHTEKALRISRVFQTDRWVDRGMSFLGSSRDSPILPIFPFVRMLMKYHYRAKGIMQAQEEQGLKSK
jgi:glycosyltransferase involved in cell wall biosynthesis